MGSQWLVMHVPVQDPMLPPFLPLPPDAIVEIVQMFLTTVAVVVIGLPFARVFARRLDRKAVASPVSSDVVARLERIENAVESIAIEVERISEGQRFAAKLLAERAAEPSALRGPQQRGT
jgi:hypothetical protein